MGAVPNPSAWPKRLPVLATAVLGCAIATYLSLYQTGVVGQLWEPFFGSGSRDILKESAIARYLPVPDAALGAAAYFVELILELIGDEHRWQTRPWIVFLLGATAAGLAFAAIVLVVCQAAVFREYCTLCLASAACSLIGAAFAFPEVMAAIRHFRRERS
jgi:uncharacterized membrane protein